MSQQIGYNELEVIAIIAPESIAEILGLGASVRTVGQLESAVSAGLPKRALERLSSRLFDDRRTASAYKFKVVPPATWKRRANDYPSMKAKKQNGSLGFLLPRNTSGMIATKRAEWMSKPHRELNGQTPLEVARTELGARRVEDLLDKLFFGLPV